MGRKENFKVNLEQAMTTRSFTFEKLVWEMDRCIRPGSPGVDVRKWLRRARDQGIERPNKNSATELEALCHALGVTPEWLWSEVTPEVPTKEETPDVPTPDGMPHVPAQFLKLWERLENHPQLRQEITDTLGRWQVRANVPEPIDHVELTIKKLREMAAEHPGGGSERLLNRGDAWVRGKIQEAIVQGNVQPEMSFKDAYENFIRPVMRALANPDTQAPVPEAISTANPQLPEAPPEVEAEPDVPIPQEAPPARMGSLGDMLQRRKRQ